jgi:hypothetical protein
MPAGLKKYGAGVLGHGGRTGVGIAGTGRALFDNGKPRSHGADGEQKRPGYDHGCKKPKRTPLSFRHVASSFGCRVFKLRREGENPELNEILFLNETRRSCLLSIMWFELQDPGFDSRLAVRCTRVGLTCIPAAGMRWWGTIHLPRFHCPRLVGGFHAPPADNIYPSVAIKVGDESAKEDPCLTSR